MSERTILSVPPLSKNQMLFCVLTAAAAAGLILYFAPDILPNSYAKNPLWVLSMAVVLAGALAQAPGFGFGLVLFVIFLENPPGTDVQMAGAYGLQCGICVLVLTVSMLGETRELITRRKTTQAES